MRSTPVVLAVLVVVSLVGLSVAPAATARQDDAYAGTHVTFESGTSTVSEYSVDGEVVVESATMLPSSDAHHQDGRHVGEDVALIGDVEGTEVVSVDSSARAGATVEFASGGLMESHDNRRGVVRFVASEGNQAVQVNVSDDAEVRAESDSRLVVETEDGPQGAFIVLGEGELGENRNGQVNANLYSGSQLVYRQYSGERTADDEAAERSIEAGTAPVEVYVQRAGDGSGDTVVDVVEYDQGTTVEVATESRSSVELLVERSVSDGAVILASLTEEAFDDVADLAVTIDGESVTAVDSADEVESSATAGEQASYYVAEGSSTEATTAVAVGVDHFSEREVELSSGDGAGTDGDGTGVGAIGALLTVVGSLLAVRYRT